MARTRHGIYIPSKGRADKCLTAILLAKEGLDFTIMVEPQDYDAYRKVYSSKQLHVLRKNDQGMAYVRTRCKRLSESRGEKAHWQIDDDVKSFSYRCDGKSKSMPAKESLSKLEELLDSTPNLAMIGHRHSAFAFSYKSKYSYNHSPATCFLVRNNLEVEWRRGTVEDADFGLQVLTLGWALVVTNRYVFSSPPHNKQAGGLSVKNSLKDPKFDRFERLASDWPQYFKVRTLECGHKKLTNLRAWSKFEQRPKRKHGSGE